MAVLRPNPRLSALPCELMRGCIFAENFVTASKVGDNRGITYGTHNIDDSAIFDGSNYIAYGNWKGHTVSDYLSVVVRFSKSTAATSKEIIIATDYTGLNAGFEIYVDADGIKANHNDGGVAPTACSVDMNYADGATHTVTYLIDLTSNEHHLYVDSLAVDTQSTYKSTTVAASSVIFLGKDSTSYFTGTFYKVRIFNQLLTEAEHDLYHAETLTSFLDNPLAVWRCDSIGDATDSNTIHDRTTNHNDLYKGDRSTAAYFPTFDTDKYFFDKADDYLSNFPTLPSAYTLSYLTSSPQLPYPVNTQETTTTTKTSLETSGDFWGYLHNVVLVNKALTTIEQYHLKYMQQYWQWRGRAWGAYNRLITEGCCVLAMFGDADRGVYTDYSTLKSGAATGVAKDGLNGLSFSSTDNVTFYHDTDQQLTEGTIVVLRKPDGSYHNETWVDKDGNYQFSCTAAGVISLTGASASSYTPGTSWVNAEHLAVTFKSGEKAQFYQDGKYLGDGSATTTLDDTSTDDIVIGNNAALSDAMDTPLQQVAIFNKILTEREIKALYESAKFIRENPMETGSRTRIRQVFTAAAVDEDIDPGDAFQLIDISINFNTAPTTSEDISITSINSDSDAVVEHTFDPSTSSLTSHVFRFDKRFPDNTTIAIDYTNTDGRTITVNTVYQLDISV